jgi:hypothetical protein
MQIWPGSHFAHMPVSSHPPSLSLSCYPSLSSPTRPAHSEPKVRYKHVCYCAESPRMSCHAMHRLFRPFAAAKLSSLFLSASLLLYHALLKLHCILRHNSQTPALLSARKCGSKRRIWLRSMPCHRSHTPQMAIPAWSLSPILLLLFRLGKRCPSVLT